MAKNTLKNIKTDELKDGYVLREFILSKPGRETTEVKRKIARCLKVKERTVWVWIAPATYRKRFRDLEREALEREFGQKIF